VNLIIASTGSFPRMEDAEKVKARVRQVLTILPKERIWVDPDRGLKTRRVEEVIAKLRACVEAAKAFRN
jgi:5-methyltetrahydropteroyltriglutamate--homocysteine methyltransferase